MKAAGYTIRENDPFEAPSTILFTKRERSPYVGRISLMWQNMREVVLEEFPQAPGIPEDKKFYVKKIEELYTSDAYHSLSIEGYRVSLELIERVRSGYWQAFQAVEDSIKKILDGNNAGQTVTRDHGAWYRELFAPSVTAGILRAGDLMPAFFDLLEKETEAAVRVVLGHFIFVYIHPYMDGNGRIGRFMMNTMMASGGYPWTIIPVEQRTTYMAALERASVDQDIRPFAQFLSGLVDI